MIGVLGLGYVGVTSALCFHSIGAKVIGVDLKQDLVENLARGKLHIHDTKLSKYLARNCRDISFGCDISALRECEDVLVCVPTNGCDGGLDLSIVRQSILKLDALGIKNIWVRSTIDEPSMFEELAPENSNIFSFPEFLREGKCWEDFFDPPLMVLGGYNAEQTEIYRLLDANSLTPQLCSSAEAITVKIACNAFHALKVAFGNEMRAIEWAESINVDRVMDIFCADKKLNISDAYLKPGLPFGGPCLPKDTKALSRVVNNGSRSGNLFDAVIQQNEFVKHLYATAIANLSAKRIGIIGLEFKKGTGDLRNSPIIDIVEILSNKKEVWVFDDFMAEHQGLEGVVIANSEEELISKVEVVISYKEIASDKVLHWNDIDVSV